MGRVWSNIRTPLVLALVAILCVALVRGRLFERHRLLRETSEVYALPPPQQLVTLSLGYRSALADLLWAHLLVSQGLHAQERRRYDNIHLLIDAINELDPTFRDPYRLADALITFNIGDTPVTADDARKARAIMERGIENRPLDADLWLGAGEFVAFIAPGTYLSDPAEQERWRVDGARMLARAAELSGGQSRIAWQAMGGARYLSRAGEIDAEIRFLERTLVVTDDDELKDKVRARLDRMLGEKRDDERIERFQRIENGVWDLRHGDLPFVTRLRYMLLGPPRDPAHCAGSAHALAARCATTFRDWEQRFDAERAR